MPALSVLHILRTIKERGVISRTDLQQRTGLSWGTITNTTRELLTRSLIREEGAIQTKSGRKPVCLSINRDTHVLAGVDISPHVLRCVALNLSGEHLWFQEVPYDMALSPDQVLDRAAGMMEAALADAAVAGRECLGVGVAAQGSIDVAGGMMRFAPRMPGWINVPIRAHLEERIKAPVLLEHDPQCLALAERWFGAATSAEDVLCILLSDGVGMGMLLGGEVFRGSEHMAGEFGHTTVEQDGLPCACGDRGCIEAYCSVTAILEMISKNPARTGALRDGDLTLEKALATARGGDTIAVAAFERMGKYLGIGVANAIDLLNPSLVVLCGDLTVAADFFLPAMEEQTQKHAWKHSTRRTVISSLGHRALAIGACGVVLQKLFESAPE